MDIKFFMEWMKAEFPEPMSNHFTYELLENICEYVSDTHCKEDAIDILYTIIPEANKHEIMEFFYI